MMSKLNKCLGALALVGGAATALAVRHSRRNTMIFHKYLYDHDLLADFLDEHGVVIVKTEADLPEAKRQMVERAIENFQKFYAK
jgi:hypothetical protein